jgi:hypothetical protein
MYDYSDAAEIKLPEIPIKSYSEFSKTTGFFDNSKELNLPYTGKQDMHLLHRLDGGTLMLIKELKKLSYYLYKTPDYILIKEL